MERLRKLSQTLSSENEGLLAHARGADVAVRGAEARARKAERSTQILEAHARDLTAQLAACLRSARAAGGGTPFRPVSAGGSAAHGDGAQAGLLAEQNAQLSLKVRRLEAERGDEAEEVRQELAELQKEQEAQVEEWKEHLAQKAEQMKELGEAVERLSRERDQAREALASLQKKAAGGAAEGGPVALEGPANQPGQAARDDFARSTEKLRAEAREARAAELEARRDAAQRQEEAGIQKARLQAMARELQDRQGRLRDIEGHLSATERALREER
ncbi:unnamed protein product, partial [Prorocentrum cordatum]